MKDGGGESFVYFIESVGSDAVKIGKADDPILRMRDLQIGNPNELRLLGAIVGDLGRENELHRLGRLERRRIRGEWFDAGWARELILKLGGTFIPGDEFATRSPIIQDWPEAWEYCPHCRSTRIYPFHVVTDGWDRDKWGVRWGPAGGVLCQPNEGRSESVPFRYVVPLDNLDSAVHYWLGRPPTFALYRCSSGNGSLKSCGRIFAYWLDTFGEPVTANHQIGWPLVRNRGAVIGFADKHDFERADENVEVRRLDRDHFIRVSD